MLSILKHLAYMYKYTYFYNPTKILLDSNGFLGIERIELVGSGGLK